MRLLVVRHAKAVEREGWRQDDSERPLTEAGERTARRMARWLADAHGVQGILTSPWLRARQTAEIFATAWSLPLRACDWLAGDGAAPEGRAAQLNPATDVAVVGHEPDLGELIGHLIGGAPIPLRKGGVAILEGTPRIADMRLVALLPPKVLAAVVR